MCKGAACPAFHAQEHIVFIEKLVGTTGFPTKQIKGSPKY